MSKQKNIPSYSSLTNKEESLLFDYYCFDNLFAFNLSFSLSKLVFSIDGCYNLSVPIKVSSNIEFNYQSFSTWTSFSQNKEPEWSLSYCPKQIPINSLLGLRDANDLNSSTQSPPKIYARPNLRAKLYPILEPSAALSGGLAYTSPNFRGKIKADNKKISGNMTIGYVDKGVGAKALLDLRSLRFTRYGAIFWYIEEKAKITGVFDVNLEKPYKHMFSMYFFQKIFDNVDFVAKVTSCKKEPIEVWIGNEAKYGKTIVKCKASSQGSIAAAFHKKILNRTRLTFSAETKIYPEIKYSYGAYFSFHAKSSSFFNADSNIS